MTGEGDMRVSALPLVSPLGRLCFMGEAPILPL